MSEPQKSKLMQHFEESAEKLQPKLKLLADIADEIERIKQVEIDPINNFIDLFEMNHLEIKVQKKKDSIEISFPHNSTNMSNRSFEIEVTDNCDVIVSLHRSYEEPRRELDDDSKERRPFQIDQLQDMVADFLRNNISPNLEERIARHIAEERFTAEQNGTDGQALGQDEPA